MKTLLVALLVALSMPLFAQTYQGAIVETGQPILVSIPGLAQPQAQSVVYVHDTQTIYKPSGKGAGSQGNTTISGSLTVTGNSFLGSGGSTHTDIVGALNCWYDAPAASTSITIQKDVTYIADAGADVTITLPTVTNGRRITIYNASATYNVTDGGANVIAPNSKLDLVGVGGSWK